MSASSDDAVAGEATWYLLDRDDRIMALDRSWNAAVEQGRGSKVAASDVIGTSIYDHVSGHFTRKFLSEFLRRARATGALSRQCYRCDTPSAKQLMEMRAEVESGDALRVSHHVVGRQALPFPVNVKDVPRAQARHLRCSICNRIKARGESRWHEPEEIVPPGQTSLVVHTVCQECRRQIDMRRQAGIFHLAR